MGVKPFLDFSELVGNEGKYLSTKKGDRVSIPPLQSDYDIYITIGANNFDNAHVLLTQSIGTEYLGNGFSAKKELFGLNTYSFSFGQNFSFSYIPTPYVEDGAEFTSYVHYLYKRQFTDSGTLRVKTRAFQLPTVTVYNKRIDKIEAVMYDCMFTMPKYNIDPKSNEFVVYNTTVAFNSYEEHLNNPVQFKI